MIDESVSPESHHSTHETLLENPPQINQTDLLTNVGDLYIDNIHSLKQSDISTRDAIEQVHHYMEIERTSSFYEQLHFLHNIDTQDSLPPDLIEQLTGDESLFDIPGNFVKHTLTKIFTEVTDGNSTIETYQTTEEDLVIHETPITLRQTFYTIDSLAHEVETQLANNSPNPTSTHTKKTATTETAKNETEAIEQTVNKIYAELPLHSPQQIGLLLTHLTRLYQLHECQIIAPPQKPPTETNTQKDWLEYIQTHTLSPLVAAGIYVHRAAYLSQFNNPQ